MYLIWSTAVCFFIPACMRHDSVGPPWQSLLEDNAMRVYGFFARKRRRPRQLRLACSCRDHRLECNIPCTEQLQLLFVIRASLLWSVSADHR
jgi:hypothetical protein